MSERREIATFFLSGTVEKGALAYVQKCLGAAQLPPDHTMVWIDMRHRSVRVAIEYGLGRDRFCVEATGAAIGPVADECVEQLRWKLASVSA